MTDDLLERYGLLLRGEGSIIASQDRTGNIEIRVFDGISKTVTLSPAEARRFASMLLVLAHRTEGEPE